MKVVKLLLLPFAALYNLVTRVRNHLYDIGHKRSFQFDTTVIAVGNLSVGGSGKTPMIEYLVRLLSPNYGVATLSRGYKRSTRGFRVAGDTDNARSIGDEPLQLFRKFGNKIKVVVGEDRVLAVPNILHEFPETDVILLDDAFQHRSIQPHLTIMLTEYQHPFFSDHVLPFGRLREGRRGASRADIIVVTKCADRPAEETLRAMEDRIKRYAGDKPVFFSGIRYGAPIPLGNTRTLERNVILVSGIARATSLEEFCLSSYTLVKHFNFPDHHRYSAKDVEAIVTFHKTQEIPVSIVTTEKDMVKLIGDDLKHLLGDVPWFYIPIETEFLQNGLKFDELVLHAVDKPAGTE